MKSGNDTHQSEPVRTKRSQELEEEILREFQKASVQGVMVGYAAGLSASVVEVLYAQGLKVHAEALRRIYACKEPEQLRAWLRRAVIIQSVQELFEASPI